MSSIKRRTKHLNGRTWQQTDNAADLADSKKKPSPARNRDGGHLAPGERPTHTGVDTNGWGMLLSGTVRVREFRIFSTKGKRRQRHQRKKGEENANENRAMQKQKSHRIGAVGGRRFAKVI